MNEIDINETPHQINSVVFHVSDEDLAFLSKIDKPNLWLHQRIHSGWNGPGLSAHVNYPIDLTTNPEEHRRTQDQAPIKEDVS